MIGAIDHVGIAVRDLEAAAARYRLLGLAAGLSEDVPHAGVRVCFIPLPGAALEFVAPLTPDSPVARFLEKRGEGLHHVAFVVRDIVSELAQMEKAGFELIDRAPRPGARGRQVAFVHPRSTHGVLLELVEEPR